MTVPIESVPEWSALVEVNEQLWHVEDALRDAERRSCFDMCFVEHARSVYVLNDRRAALKACVDERLQSNFTDLKSFTAPKPEPTPDPGAVTPTVSS